MHNHEQCRHKEAKYCEKCNTFYCKNCDVFYCKNCKKEWRVFYPSVTIDMPNPYITYGKTGNSPNYYPSIAL